MNGNFKIRVGIGAKLMTLICLLLVTSIAVIVWLSTRLFVEDNTALIQQMNADLAASRATETRAFFKGVTREMRLSGKVLLRKQESEFDLLGEDQSFLALFLYENQPERKLGGQFISARS